MWTISISDEEFIQHLHAIKLYIAIAMNRLSSQQGTENASLLATSSAMVKCFSVHTAVRLQTSEICAT